MARANGRDESDQMDPRDNDQWPMAGWLVARANGRDESDQRDPRDNDQGPVAGWLVARANGRDESDQRDPRDNDQGPVAGWLVAGGSWLMAERRECQVKNAECRKQTQQVGRLGLGVAATAGGDACLGAGKTERNGSASGLFHNSLRSKALHSNKSRTIVLTGARRAGIVLSGLRHEAAVTMRRRAPGRRPEPVAS